MVRYSIILVRKVPLKEQSNIIQKMHLGTPHKTERLPNYYDIPVVQERPTEKSKKLKLKEKCNWWAKKGREAENNNIYRPWYDTFDIEYVIKEIRYGTVCIVYGR